jgi:hypothetical protein
MAASKTKTPTVAEQAKQNLHTLEVTEQNLVAELAKLEQEHQTLEQAAESGDASADIARLDELAESDIPRTRRRLEGVTETQLPAARERVAVAELAELVDSLAGGIGGEAQRLADERAEGERLIVQGVQKLRESAEQWNGVVEPIIAKAHTSGLVVGESDPLLRVQAVTAPFRGYGSQRPVGVVVDGTEHRPVDADRAVQKAVRLADERVGRLVAQAVEEQELAAFKAQEIPAWR